MLIGMEANKRLSQSAKKPIGCGQQAQMPTNTEVRRQRGQEVQEPIATEANRCRSPWLQKPIATGANRYRSQQAESKRNRR